LNKRESLRIRNFLIPYWKRIFLAAALTLIAVGIDLFPPLIMKQMLDEALPKKNMQLLLIYVLGLVLIPVLSAILNTFVFRIHNKIGGFVTDQIYRQCMKKLLRVSPRIFNEFTTGNVSVRLDRIEDIGDNFVKWDALRSIAEVFTFVGLLAVMFSLNWKLAFILLMMIPISLFVSHRFGKQLEENFQEVESHRRDLSGYNVQLLGGIKTIQLLTREKEEWDHQERYIRQFRRVRNTAFMNQMLRFPIYGTLERAFIMTVVFSVSIYFIIQGQMTVGTLLAYTLYFPWLFGSAKILRSAYMSYMSIKPKVKQVTEIIKLPVEIKDLQNASSLEKANGAIDFGHVSFSYEGGQPQIKDMSFRVNPGEFIGIVGPTGAGKSTILDLLLRFYDPDEGEILLDGKNIKEYKLHDLRNRIGLVTQDVFLWDKTIKENLLYANPEATMDELLHACNIAQVTPILERLPQGWDTLIGERGVKLSGGEKQRLGIARVLLRQPQILLMDEPTSALDAKTEAQLQSELESVFKDKTVIVVAHRLATIRNADRIIVVKNGTIAEIGTHEELMHNQSVYYQLYTEQFQGSLMKEIREKEVT
jgi:ABC-type multidrug transport system fused ATPase/permease subunit